MDAGTVRRVRWERLFDDLEARFEEAQRAELAAEVADRTRREVARVRLADRLRGALGHPVSCQALGAGRVEGTLRAVGPEWLLLDEGAGREALLPLPAVLAVSGLGLRSAPPGLEGAVARRLGLGHCLRVVARDRSAVALRLVDGSTVTGTVDRVGADFLELAEHGWGEPRRREDVLGVRTVPFGAVAVLRRVADPAGW